LEEEFESIWRRRLKESLKYSKQSLMGNSGDGSEDQNAHRNTDSRGYAGKVSDGNEEYWKLD
jgi:hypothetical protein